MAVTIDIGNPDNVHPHGQGRRGPAAGAAARALSYGEALEYSGPIFRQATPEGRCDSRVVRSCCRASWPKAARSPALKLQAETASMLPPRRPLMAPPSSPRVRRAATRASALRLGKQPGVQSVQRRWTARLALYVGEVAPRFGRQTQNGQAIDACPHLPAPS